ncbi:hypothetical protein [uncultured Thiodictyon sp.]|uniref:hypothetical protein n=1 Tax=uncultured Thiodictyon sp. TaxID=1846217 RepID=UPI0025EEB3C3|nr:hypothetical protein [uncultured Thiodictyon sp.]
MERLDPSLLPPQIRKLIRLLGTEDAVNLLKTWGGQRRWVPADPTLATPQLRACLSPAALAALCQSEFGGLATDWPKVDKVLRQSIWAAMRADRAAGCTANDLAVRYGYTRRRARTIAPAHAPFSPDLQRDLFD